MTPCIVCREETSETVAGQPKHLNREGCVAALRARIERVEKRRRESWRQACDLCTNDVHGDGKAPDSDWRWVEEGWSIACRKCLALIVEPSVAALRERVERVEEEIRALVESYERQVAYDTRFGLRDGVTRIHDVELRVAQAFLALLPPTPAAP